MTTDTCLDPVELHAGRSAVYEFLACAFAYPTAARAERLGDVLVPELRELPPDVVPDSLIQPVLKLLSLPLETLRRGYGLVFTHTVSPDCPTYETAYSARDIFQQAQSMADCAGFYRAHGLTVGGPERERPDHIATELEFMSFLALKQAYALEHLGDEQVAMCVEAQRLFLRDHLGRWGGSLGRRTIATATGSPFHAAAGALLTGWLEIECGRVGTGQITPLDEPVVPLPEPDEGICGGPAPSSTLIGFNDIPVEGVRK